MKQLIIACITALATGSAFGMHSSLVEEKVLGNVKDASETAGKAAAEQRMAAAASDNTQRTEIVRQNTANGTKIYNVTTLPEAGKLMRKLPSRRDLAALQQSDLEQFKLLLASIKRMCASDLQATTAMYQGLPENTLEKRFQKARMLYLQMILTITDYTDFSRQLIELTAQYDSEFAGFQWDVFVGTGFVSTGL